MKFFYILLILCFTTVHSFQMQQGSFFIKMNFTEMKFSDSIKAIVKKLSKRNVFESATVGFVGLPSQQYKLYETLSESATQDELTDLATTNDNAVVRLYAVKALIKRNGLTNAIEKQFENDGSVVSTLNGCIGGKITVKEIFRTMKN